MRARVGTVAFLNALPLAAGLEREPGLELVADTPARVARGLEERTLDVGLVPVVEAARLRLVALGGAGVVARGAVGSVLLLARVPLARVRVLALDPASRTSALLARLLLLHEHALRPRLVAAPASGDPLPQGADAALVIGDRALGAPPAGARAIDLAGWWRGRTGLPFVFALWAGADEVLLRSLAPLLLRARDRGLVSLAAIAARAPETSGVDGARALAYLTGALAYRVGDEERRALELFLDELRRAGLLEPEARLRFVEAAPSPPLSPGTSA